MSTERAERSIQDELSEAVAQLGAVEGPAIPAQFLELVGAAQQMEVHAQELLREAVHSARAAGATWTDIGKTLGVSKQAAQKRFAPPKAAVTGALDPGERLVGPVGFFDEVDELNLAGRYGWHSVEFTWAHHRVVRSATQWEHRRVASAKEAEGLEAEGWVRFGRSFPYIWLKRDLGTPALAEP